MERTSKVDLSASGQSWQKIVARYHGADVRMSTWQLVTSFVPYAVMWYVMYLSLSTSYALTLLLSVLASGFLLRIFIIFHDCTHGSFFKSRRANHVVGVICGLLTFTPFGEWRHRHNLHHATTGNLDKRGWWDIDVLTVKEYLALPPRQQLMYRLYRNPIVLFALGATFFFLVIQRIPRRDARPKERNSVLLTNLGLVALNGTLIWLVGWQAYLLIQLPIAILSSTFGLWMFYVQHQFEQAYWEWDPEWDYVTASLKGSSFYRLPRILQWFTGNIGFHHIHHLSAKIPNYRLEQCYRENTLFQDVNEITLRSSLEALKAKVWDEDLKRMLDFKEVRARYGHLAHEGALGARPPSGSSE